MNNKMLQFLMIFLVLNFETSIPTINETLQSIKKTNLELQKAIRNINENPGMFLAEPQPKEER